MRKRMLGLYVRLRETSKGIRRGQTMSEYALILATIAAVCFSLIGTAGNVVKALVNQVGPLL